LEAATSVVENMVDGLAPSGYMRYAPDGWSPSSHFCDFKILIIAFLGHFVFASFASAFLLKVCFDRAFEKCYIEGYYCCSFFDPNFRPF
jgi:hypothetical protein